jgi:SAM-dependent methyltransferase
LKPRLESRLYQKALGVVDRLESHWQQQEGINREDAELIRKWVLEALEPEDYRRFARVDFEETWVDTLVGEELPHLNHANRVIGSAVASLISSGEPAADRHAVVLDLGTGTLGTIEAIAEQGVLGEFVGVDLVPQLTSVARDRALKLTRRFPDIRIEVFREDMVHFLQQTPTCSMDFVTSSFAIHHLHPLDQASLLAQAFRCLRRDGAMLIADPYEGKSDYNLQVLVWTKLEAIFAYFTSPEEMIRNLEDTGFGDCQILWCDDAGYTGYVVMGRRV